MKKGVGVFLKSRTGRRDLSLQSRSQGMKMGSKKGKKGPWLRMEGKGEKVWG